MPVINPVSRIHELIAKVGEPIAADRVHSVLKRLQEAGIKINSSVTRSMHQSITRPEVGPNILLMPTVQTALRNIPFASIQLCSLEICSSPQRNDSTYQDTLNSVKIHPIQGSVGAIAWAQYIGREDVWWPSEVLDPFHMPPMRNLPASHVRCEFCRLLATNFAPA